jgi:hypothetical protein
MDKVLYKVLAVAGIAFASGCGPKDSNLVHAPSIQWLNGTWNHQKVPNSAALSFDLDNELVTAHISWVPREIVSEDGSKIQIGCHYDIQQKILKIYQDDHALYFQLKPIVANFVSVGPDHIGKKTDCDALTRETAEEVNKSQEVSIDLQNIQSNSFEAFYPYAGTYFRSKN